MKRAVLFFSCLAAVFAVSNAQTKKTAKPAAKQAADKTPAHRHTEAVVYLGNSDRRGGLIPKRVFDSLVNQGLTARDSFGVVGRVTQFRIYYKERSLVEDSAGKMYISVELLTDFSNSNKLNNYMGSSVTDRTKKGDTAFFDDILVKMPDSLNVRGVPMKFIIDK